jgi:L-ascorbate metabolism protein UlaG (beta-lactamase superfamily)
MMLRNAEAGGDRGCHGPMRLVAALFLFASAGLSQSGRLAFEDFPSSAGLVRIAPIQQGALVMHGGGKFIYVDPALGHYEDLPKADLILITDSYVSHLAPKIVARLEKPGTLIFAPEGVAKTIPGAMAIRNGEARHFWQWIVEAVPAYYLKHVTGMPWHDMGSGNGYLLTYGGQRFYISGDTESTPEMHALRDIDVAFVSMQEQRMTPQQAADTVRVFHPKIVYPYQYSGAEAEEFEKALLESGIDVRLRNWHLWQP